MFQNLLKIGMLVWGEAIQKLRQKGVYEESLFTDSCKIGVKLIQFMHTTMVHVQVKTMKTQAGVQVSRQGELRRHLQLWKCFERLISVNICTYRNIGFVFEERPNEAFDVPIKDVKSSSPKESMIKEIVDASINFERERQAKVKIDASGSGPVKGQNTAPAVRECTFVGFMKCNPIVFHGIEGAIELRRWFEKTESVFGISECAEGKKVRFVAATLEGPTLTWWNSKVATLGLENVNQMPWTEMKQLMTAEFCLIEEIQRLENELWNFKVKEYDIVAYT
ncbi:hypothetical protein Tco_0642923 [Tanacetum coccineum]